MTANIEMGCFFMKNVIIEGTGVYTPKNAVYNADIDEHFNKRGLSAHNLMEHLGRKNGILFQKEKIPLLCVRMQLKIV